MKPLQHIAYIIIILFLLYCVTRKCEGDTISTPTVTGTLHDTLPIQYDTIRLQPNTRVVYKSIVQELRITDTLTRTDTIYAAIDTLRTVRFSKSIEDEYLKLDINGVVTGRIEGIGVDYLLKPQKVEAPRKPSSWSIGITAGADVYGKPNLVGGINYALIKL